MPNSPPSPPLLAPRAAWAILLALVAGFALSQAFRTITAIMATGLQAEFGLSAQALGVFAGTFAFAFGTMQLFMGIAIDFWGIRRTCARVWVSQRRACSAIGVDRALVVDRMIRLSTRACASWRGCAVALAGASCGFCCRARAFA